MEEQRAVQLPSGGAIDQEAAARREFVKKLGKAGAAVPAAALLMAANFQSAQAADTYGSGGGCGCGCGSGV